jgi:O-antigen/teichoic acid export membrane protein
VRPKSVLHAIGMPDSPDPGGNSPKETSPQERSNSVQAPARRGLARTLLTGTGWLLAQFVTTRAISFVSQIVLARILAPTDFATLALAITVTAILETLVNFGIDDVLLQRQRAMRFWTTSAFLMSLGLGLFAMLLAISISPLAVQVYDAPMLSTILPIMAAGMPFSATAAVPAAKLRAELNFRFLATYHTIELAIGQAAVIVLALSSWGVLSFVLPTPILAASRSIIFWMQARPRFGPLRRKQIRIIAKAGSNVFGTKILTAMVSQGAYFVLGLFASKSEVGAYFFAFRLAIQPVHMLAGSFSNVLFPALTQLRHDVARQRAAALSACQVLAFAVMPYCFMQAAVARPIFNLLFGSKWDAAILPMQILSVGLAFDAMSWISGALLSARGEFRRLFIYACLFTPAFFLVVTIGACVATSTGVAIAASLFYIVVAPSFSYVVFRSMGSPFRDVVGIYAVPTVFAIVSIGAAAALTSRIPLGPLAEIGITLAFGGGLYLSLVRLLAPATFKLVASRLRDAIRAK